MEDFIECAVQVLFGHFRDIFKKSHLAGKTIKDSSCTCSTGEEQPYIKSGENSFSMEQEVEYLVPVSNDWLY